MSMPNNDRGMKEESSVLIKAFGMKLISAKSGLGDRFGDVGGTGGDVERCCSRQFFSIRPFLLLINMLCCRFNQIMLISIYFASKNARSVLLRRASMLSPWLQPATASSGSDSRFLSSSQSDLLTLLSCSWRESRRRVRNSWQSCYKKIISLVNLFCCQCLRKVLVFVPVCNLWIGGASQTNFAWSSGAKCIQTYQPTFQTAVLQSHGSNYCSIL